MAKKDSNEKDNSETHPNFPSGDWEGFYTYAYGMTAAKHTMFFMLNFKDGIISGTGSDDVGAFTWRGTYDIKSLQCQMTKYYAAHTVSYAGHADENGIWGNWSIVFDKGGFHIWPKNNGKNEEEEEVVEAPLEVALEVERVEVKQG